MSAVPPKPATSPATWKVGQWESSGTTAGVSWEMAVRHAQGDELASPHPPRRLKQEWFWTVLASGGTLVCDVECCGWETGEEGAKRAAQDALARAMRAYLRVGLASVPRPS